MTSTPTIDSITILGASIQEATVTVTAETELEANKIAGTWLLHHANKSSLVISVVQREDVKHHDGTFTMRYF